MAPKRSKVKPDPFKGTSPDVQKAMEKILSTYNAHAQPNISDPSYPTNLMRHLANQDEEDLQALMQAMSRMDASGPDLATFDYASVPVRRNSFWVLQVMPAGFQSSDGRVQDDYFTGSKPIFDLVIYDDHSSFLVTETPPEPGLPSSDFLLHCIKKAIAAPLPPLRPCLPSMLLLAYKLGPHVPALRPFLDSLPAPFTWRIETPEEADTVATGVQDTNVQGVAKALSMAESAKALGNAAFGRKDRADAVKRYTEAIESLQDAWAQKPTDAEMRRVKAMISVCYANRAAAWLLEGDGQDAAKALKDAELASSLDQDYDKAYYRQAKAYQVMSQPSKAIDVLTSALRKPKLAQERALNEALIAAFGGLPETEDELRRFCLTMFKDANGEKRARGLKEFERRVNTHVRKVLGPKASISSL